MEALEAALVESDREEKERLAQEEDRNDHQAIIPDYDLGDVRLAIQKFREEVASSYLAEMDLAEKKYLSTLKMLAKISGNLVQPQETEEKEEKVRSIDLSKCEFFQNGWQGALNVLTFCGFTPVPESPGKFALLKADEITIKIQRANSIIRRVLEEYTPTELDLLKRAARARPPSRELKFMDNAAVRNPKLEASSAAGKADAALVLKAMGDTRKRLQEQNPEVLVTRQRRQEEREKSRRAYDQTLIRVFFNDQDADHRLVLQAYFSPYEPVRNLFSLVEQQLGSHAAQEFQFSLPPRVVITKPPPPSTDSIRVPLRQREDSMGPTLADLQLVPAAFLHFQWTNGDGVARPLQPHCYDQKQAMALAAVPRAQGTAMDETKDEVEQVAESQEDPVAKKMRLREEAMMKKFGF